MLFSHLVKKPLFYEYIHEGIMRFVTSKYAEKLSFAVMLGYVMDESLTTVLDILEKGLIKHSIKTKQLEITKTLPNSSSFICSCSSSHQRTHDSSIEIRLTYFVGRYFDLKYSPFFLNQK